METKEIRNDGYENIINSFGTSQDNSTAYKFQREGTIPDEELTAHYEGNGLFAKIIDAPSEEAVKHGFEHGIKEQDVAEVIENTFDTLNWDEAAATAVKWARLYGGSIIVMLIDDGGELNDPLNVKKIRKIDELKVYERSVVNPDYTAMLYGRPQYFQVSSIYGYFVVHESRCLVFKNGILPERTANMMYRFWGIPEYLRISRQLRECSTSHGYGVRLLERSIQPVYKMTNLAQLTDIEGGDESVITRLRLIDKARGILNTIAIDSEGEDYHFETMTLSGVKDILEATCNMLSAVTSIPQAILFGRSPAGMNATGESDLETYYNLIERIQRIMLRSNLKTLIDIVIRAAIAQGEITEKPTYKIGFKPLWSLSETEQATVEQTKATTAHNKAQTAQIYVDMGALDPSEVRTGLADDDAFEVEKLLDGMEESELWGNYEEPLAEENTGSGIGAISEPQTSEKLADTALNGAQISSLIEVIKNVKDGVLTRDSGIAIMMASFLYSREKAETILGEVSSPTDPPQEADSEELDETDSEEGGTVGVIVFKNGKVLVGCRSDDGTIASPGGHIEDGEKPSQAAIRETEEEFGIKPTELRYLGKIDNLPEEYGNPHIYLCTAYKGYPKCESGEILTHRWIKPDIENERLFPPFREALRLASLDSEDNLQKGLTNSDEYGILCIDGDSECRAANPATCPVHGSGGVKERNESDMRDFEKINEEVKSLIDKGVVKPAIGEAMQAVPTKILGINDHARVRNVTLEEAQSFVDTAEVMFNQNTRNMYLSRDGSATVLVENGRLISAYRRENFDPAIKAIFEVIDNV